MTGRTTDIEAEITSPSNASVKPPYSESIESTVASTMDLLIYATLEHITMNKMCACLTIQPSWLHLIFWIFASRIRSIISAMIEGRIACETGRQKAVYCGVYLVVVFVVSAIGMMLAKNARVVYA